MILLRLGESSTPIEVGQTSVLVLIQNNQKDKVDFIFLRKDIGNHPFNPPVFD
jgi:hypothetical protein